MKPNETCTSWAIANDFRFMANHQHLIQYLMINAAATFRTFGHFSNATTVNEFPQIPTIIINMVAAAAKFNNGRPNLQRCEWKKRKKNCYLKRVSKWILQTRNVIKNTFWCTFPNKKPEFIMMLCITLDVNKHMSVKLKSVQNVSYMMYAFVCWNYLKQHVH